ncbi:MAG: hypothetical protein PUP91_37420 [Rhizonema sp. PD37]|nr:hypothetical protein [Rhizonema sp. PD37]
MLRLLATDPIVNIIPPFKMVGLKFGVTNHCTFAEFDRVRGINAGQSKKKPYREKVISNRLFLNSITDHGEFVRQFFNGYASYKPTGFTISGKAGHRVNAINLVDKAISETQKGIAAAQ